MPLDVPTARDARLPERRPRPACARRPAPARRCWCAAIAHRVSRSRTASRCCCSTRPCPARTGSATTSPPSGAVIWDPDFDETLLDDPQRLAQRDEQGLLLGARDRGCAGAPRGGDRRRLRGRAAARRRSAARDAGGHRFRAVVRFAADRPAQLYPHPGADLARRRAAALGRRRRRVAHRFGRRPTSRGWPNSPPQGAQRGLAMAVVAPAGTEVAVAAGRAPLHELPRDLHPRAARWSVLTPLLQALDALGVNPIPSGLLIEVADALDEKAEAAGRDGDAFTNPAKALALEFADVDRRWSSAPAPSPAWPRGRSPTPCSSSPGYPAMSVSLPDGVGRAGALLRGAGAGLGRRLLPGPGRRTGAGMRPRLLVVGDDGSADDMLLGERSDAQIQLDEVAARRAAAACTNCAAQPRAALVVGRRARRRPAGPLRRSGRVRRVHRRLSRAGPGPRSGSRGPAERPH